MTNITCESCTDKLSEYIDGTLTEDENAAVTAHLSECVQCRQEYEQLVKTISMLGDIKYNPDGAVYDAVMKRLHEEHTVPVKNKRILKAIPKSAYLGMLTAAAAVALVVFLGRGYIPDNNAVTRSAVAPELAAGETMENTADDDADANAKSAEDGMLLSGLTAGNSDSEIEENSASDEAAEDDAAADEDEGAALYGAPSMFSNAMTMAYDPVAVYTEQYAPEYSGYVCSVAIIHGAQGTPNGAEDYIDTVEYSDAAVYINVYSDETLAKLKSSYIGCEVYSAPEKSSDAEYIVIIMMKNGG